MPKSLRILVPASKKKRGRSISSSADRSDEDDKAASAYLLPDSAKPLAAKRVSEDMARGKSASPKTVALKDAPKRGRKKADYIKHRTASLDGVHSIEKALERFGVTEDEIKRSKAMRTLGGTEDTFIETTQVMRRNMFDELSRGRSFPRDAGHLSSCTEYFYTEGLDDDYIFTDDVFAAVEEMDHKCESAELVPPSMSLLEAIGRSSSDVPLTAPTTVTLLSKTSVSCPSSPATARVSGKRESDLIGLGLDDPYVDGDVKDFCSLHSDDDPVLPELSPKSDFLMTPSSDGGTDTDKRTSFESAIVGRGKKRKVAWSKPAFSSRTEMACARKRYRRMRHALEPPSIAPIPARIRSMFGDDLSVTRKAHRILGTDHKTRLEKRSKMLGDLGDRDLKRAQLERSEMDASRSSLKRGLFKLKRSLTARSSKENERMKKDQYLKPKKKGSAYEHSSSVSPSPFSVTRSSDSHGWKKSRKFPKLFGGSILSESEVDSSSTVSLLTASQKHEVAAEDLLRDKRRTDMSVTALSLLGLRPGDDVSKLIRKSQEVTHSTRRKAYSTQQLELSAEDVAEHREVVLDFIQSGYGLEQIIGFFVARMSFSPALVIAILDAIDECAQLFCDSCDTPMDILRDLSPFQYVVRTQATNVEKFFYKYGPTICRYHNIHSPLHLAARRLVDLTKDYHTHVVQSSPPEFRTALKTFRFLLAVGFYFDDGDWSQPPVCTPQSILRHVPRVLKQTQDCHKKLLKNQRNSMKVISDMTNLPIVLLRQLECFTFNQIPRSVDYLDAALRHRKSLPRAKDTEQLSAASEK